MSTTPADIEARISNRGEAQLNYEPATVKDFKGKVDPDWCPGCGDFGILVCLETGARGAGPSSSPGDGDQRYRLFLEHTRFH